MILDFLSFRKVAYTMYDVPWFIQQMNLGMPHNSSLLWPVIIGEGILLEVVICTSVLQARLLMTLVLTPSGLAHSLLFLFAIPSGITDLNIHLWY
jgi:hypothetical protein